MECLLFNSRCKKSLVLPRQGNGYTLMCSKGICYLPRSENENTNVGSASILLLRPWQQQCFYVLILIAKITHPSFKYSKHQQMAVRFPTLRAMANSYMTVYNTFWSLTTTELHVNALLTFPNIVTLEVSVLEQGFPQIKTVENVWRITLARERPRNSLIC